jgi:excisionase family DNA binding protein
MHETPHDTPVRRRAHTVPQAIHALNLSRTTLYAEIKAGRLRSFTVGKKRLIPDEALDEYIAARIAEGGAE